MEVTAHAPSRSLGYFVRSSPRFWLCNVLAWLSFNLAEGLRNSVDGSPLVDNLLSYLPPALFGVVAGGFVCFFYKRLRWDQHHPIQLIPIASLIAFIFGLVNTTLNNLNLVFSLPEICASDYPRPSHTCGQLSDLFLQSMGAMLIWCLFYFLIQAERKPTAKQSYNAFALIKGLIALLFLSYLGTHLSVVAWMEWGDTHYLYSRAYFVNGLCLFLPLISTAYVLFIRSDWAVLGSTTFALIPLLFIVSLCCVAFNMGVGGAITRIAHLPEYWTIRYILFGEVYGNFSHPNYLAGVIDGSFVSTLSITLFYLTCRYKPSKQKNNKNPAQDLNFKSISVKWLYYFLFWLVFGLLLYTTDIMGWDFFGKTVTATHLIAFTFFGTFIGALLRSQILYFAAKQTSLHTLTLKVVITSVYAGILLSFSIWLSSYAYILIVLKGFGIEKYSSFVAVDNFVLANIISSCVICGLWSFVCYMIESMRLYRESTIKQLQLEKNMKEVQLNALAGRLDPHFIFNALNNIRALVNEDSEKARNAIAVLSDILRSPIASNAQDKSTLKEEIALVRNYIAIAEIQFEDRLDYKEDISEKALTALIPSMMLQILVENAIKHGISQLPDGGTLIVKVKTCEQKLICEVISSGQLKSTKETEGFGLGLKAVRDRLYLLYADNARFSLYEEDNTVIAKLVLPFETTL